MDNRIGPVSLRERIEVVDVLRGLAVGGILVGNMQWFSGYGMRPPALAVDVSTLDHVVTFIVHFLIEGKFYSIFSFLFGFGFALQIARAEERGDTKASVFKRRLFWLLVIGLLHAYLLWAGDILSIYALVGFVLLLFRKKSNEALLKWAFILVLIPIATYVLLYCAFVMFAPPDVAASVQDAQLNQWTRMTELVSHGSYVEIIRDYNARDYIIGRYLGLIFQMRLPKILAMFLLGMYAYRIGVFQNPPQHRVLIRRVLIYGLSIGVIGNILMAWLAGNEAAFPPSAGGALGVIGYGFGVPALALGITALILTIWQSDPGQRVLSFLAPAGRMALTNYLMQTVICLAIFYGFGFGLFGHFYALQATLIALAIFAAQIVISSVWLRFFRFGPMEWIWRQLTYRQRLPLRKTRMA